MSATNRYQLHQDSPIDMQTLMVLAEEEYMQTSKNAAQTVMKVKTTKIDYMRTDPNSKTNRFSPEVMLSLKNEESKDALAGGRAVTCFECSMGLQVRTLEKADKVEKNTLGYTKHQLAVCKELIERGMFSVATHFCMTCDATGKG